MSGTGNQVPTPHLVVYTRKAQKKLSYVAIGYLIRKNRRANTCWFGGGKRPKDQQLQGKPKREKHNPF